MIIVNYNTLEMTKNCIESVLAKTDGVSYEIILVDNASTDGSKEYFVQDKRIKYIYSNDNLGFGKANNLGYKEAKGDFIFLLNSDTVLLNNAIFEFFKYAQRSDKRVGCIGGLLLNDEKKIIHSYAAIPTVKTFFKNYINNYTRLLGLNLVKDTQDYDNLRYPLEVGYVTGADLFIKREVIEKFGLFDPSFFMYYEETEMQFRYKKKGTSSVIITGPQIIHLCGGSQKKSLRSWEMELTGGFTFSKLCFNRCQYYFIRLTAFILFMPKVLLYPATLEQKRKTMKSLFKRIKVSKVKKNN